MDIDQDSPAIGAANAPDSAPVSTRRHGLAPTPVNMVDLVADSLRALCQDERDGDRVYWLMARVIDLRLADNLLEASPGRWRKEALDALLSLVSEQLQQQLRLHLGNADAVGGKHRRTAGQ